MATKNEFDIHSLPSISTLVWYAVNGPVPPSTDAASCTLYFPCFFFDGDCDSLGGVLFVWSGLSVFPEKLPMMRS